MKTLKPMGEFNHDSDWKWNGTLWDFVEIIQLAMVVRDVGKTNGDLDIISDPKRVLEYAYDHGITRRAVIREMLRIATDGANMLWAIDEANNSHDIHESGNPGDLNEGVTKIEL